ncbi:MAG: phenylalanine--tRNA ligase subunit beta [Bacteroidetes bacterium]|nr:phenylalanine--tRNA ligase subunit beta [Bacteroidota bacterium]
MKISYNWLKRYINVDVESVKLAELLTDCGLEVEGWEMIQSVKGALNGVVIGEVKTKIKHPNADKLVCTTVDVGGDHILPIVCGAPNVEVGQKVPVATVGTTIYLGDDSFVIKKSKIRGEVSEGMICAEDELGLGTEHDGIMVLNPEAKTGSLAKDYFEIEEDYVFEIGLTPNRADATSHIGVARDLVAVLNHHYPTKKINLKIPSIENFTIENESRLIDIVVEDSEACPRYTGITISGIEVKESPTWLKNQLTSLGLKSINNIVDVTNFVLFETGQPLHAFDADAIKGDKVTIKKLANKTTFTTLDKIERSLTQNDLMICNQENGMCIAGVFGGLGSGVTNSTKNIFLESAYFDASTIRKTSKHHSLQTDASFRFERGADPNITEYALKRACLLFQELAGGKTSSRIIDIYPTPIEKWSVDIKYTNVDRLIGKVIDRSEIKRILVNLGIEITIESDLGLSLLIPTYKVDVTREADVIEEILRIYGYNNIEISDSLNSSLSYRDATDKKEKTQNFIANYLSDNGFYEIINNSLINSKYADKSDAINAKNNVYVLNPVSIDLNVMRQSLLFGGLESVVYNQNRKNTDLRFYEFGRIYAIKKDESQQGDPLNKYTESTHLSILLSGKTSLESWQQESINIDFFTTKFYIDQVLKRIGLNTSNLKISNQVNENFSFGQSYELNNNTIVSFGLLKKEILKQFDIKQEVFYADFNWGLLIKAVRKAKVQFQEINKFHEVRRDLAMLLNKEITFEELKKLAFQTERKLLIAVSLFDIYEGVNIEKDKKSYAVSFILQDQHQTLTDKIVDKVMNKIMKAFEQNLQAVIRK